MLISELGSCIFRYKKYLAAFLALALLLCCGYVNMRQSYTAEVYIKYLGEQAKDGLAADGCALNPYEITNGLVIKNTLVELGMEDVSQESIRKNITVTPIVTTAEEEKYASWIESFDNYDEDSEAGKEYPVHYSIKFRTELGSEFAARFLAELVEQYRGFYVENHAYSSDIIGLAGIATMEYDYFDTAEMIEKKISDNVRYLSNVADSDTDYRSPVNGYSVTDLMMEFKALYECELASISRDIIEKGLSKNPDVLVNSLKNRADLSLLQSNENSAKAESHKTLLKVYSEKNKEYTWGYGSANDESSQVREDIERDYMYKRDETTYDNMMLEYTSYAASSRDQLIDKAYYEECIKYFNKKEPSTNPEVEAKLEAVCERYNDLHHLTEETLADYNFYKSARYITTLSGVSSHETMGEMIYYAATVILVLGLGVLIILFNELKKRRKI